MKTIDDLHEQWAKDSIIDSTKLGEEAINTPHIHSKYLRYLTDTRLIHRKVESSYQILKSKKVKYYRGEMTREELLENNWNQYQGIKPLKSDMDSVLDNDPDMIKISEKLEYYKTFVSAIEFIMKELNSRHWAIRSGIDYQKMQNGLN